MLVMVVGLDVGIWVSGGTRDHQRGIIVPSELTATEPSSSDPTHISNHCSIRARHQTLSFPSHVSKLTLCHQKHQTFNNNKIRRYFQQKLYFSKLPKNITARHHKKISRRLKLPVFLRNPSIFVNPPFLRLGSQRQAGYYSFPIPVFNWQRPDPDPVQCPTYSLFTLDLGCSIWGLECCPISRWSRGFCTNIKL